MIIFLEGSCGELEIMSGLKKGIYYLVKNYLECVVLFVVMCGLGCVLFKGMVMFVFFNCDVVIGELLTGFSDVEYFV